VQQPIFQVIDVSPVRQRGLAWLRLHDSGTVEQHQRGASLSPLWPQVTHHVSPERRLGLSRDSLTHLREKIEGFRSKLFHSNKCSVKCIRQQKWKQAFSVCFSHQVTVETLISCYYHYYVLKDTLRNFEIVKRYNHSCFLSVTNRLINWEFNPIKACSNYCNKIVDIQHTHWAKKFLKRKQIFNLKKKNFPVQLSFCVSVFIK